MHCEAALCMYTQHMLIGRACHIAAPSDMDTDLADLIAHMLVLDPTKRLTLPQIREHACFKGVSKHIMPCRVVSCRVVLCHVMSRRVVSRVRAMSCDIHADVHLHTCS